MHSVCVSVLNPATPCGKSHTTMAVGSGADPCGSRVYCRGTPVQPARLCQHSLSCRTVVYSYCPLLAVKPSSSCSGVAIAALGAIC
jgi:hypothetical protein